MNTYNREVFKADWVVTVLRKWQKIFVRQNEIKRCDLLKFVQFCCSSAVVLEKECLVGSDL